MLIAVVFYASIYITGSRTSEIDFLDAQQITRESTENQPNGSNPGPSSSTHVTPPSSSTSQSTSRVRKSKQKPKTNLSINGDSDDESVIAEPTLINL